MSHADLIARIRRVLYDTSCPDCGWPLDETYWPPDEDILEAWSYVCPGCGWEYNDAGERLLGTADFRDRTLASLLQEALSVLEES